MNTFYRSPWARFCLFALLFALCLPDAAWGKRKKKRPRPKVPAAASKKTMPPPDLSRMGERISLLDLEAEAKDPDALTEPLLEALRAGFILPVSSQRGLKALADELKCPKIDALCLGHVGAKVGARYLVYGSAQERGGKVSFALRLFDAKEAREISAATGSVSDPSAPEALAPLLDQLLREAARLRRLPLPALVFEIPSAQKPSTLPPIPLREGKARKEPEPSPETKTEAVARGALTPEASPPPGDPPGPSLLKNRRVWLWALIVAGGLGGGVGGGVFLATRPPKPVDSDLGRFPVR